MIKLKNFKVQELVPEEVYKLWADESVEFMDEAFLLDVDQFVSDIKKDLKVRSVTVNDWLWGGKFHLSGYRYPTTAVGATNSMHKKGKALDLKFSGANVLDCYNYLLSNQSRYRTIRRIESIDCTPTWLHVDSKPTNKDGIHVFIP